MNLLFFRFSRCGNHKFRFRLVYPYVTLIRQVNVTTLILFNLQHNYINSPFISCICGLACWSTDHYHLCSNLRMGISEGCFISDFTLVPTEVAQPIQPTKVAVKGQSSIIQYMTGSCSAKIGIMVGHRSVGHDWKSQLKSEDCFIFHFMSISQRLLGQFSLSCTEKELITTDYFTKS